MFLFGKKKKEAAGEPKLYAPLTGECMPIDKVPDPVFADKILGDGRSRASHRRNGGSAL